MNYSRCALVLTFIAGFISFNTIGNTHLIDSIVAINANDSVKLKIITTYCVNDKNDITNRLLFFEKTDSLFNGAKDAKVLFGLASLESQLLKETGKQSEALTVCDHTLNAYPQLSNLSEYVSLLHLRRNIYKDLGKFEEALTDFGKIIRFHEQNKDYWNEAKILMSISIVLAKNKQMPEAIKNLLLADSLITNHCPPTKIRAGGN